MEKKIRSNLWKLCLYQWDKKVIETAFAQFWVLSFSRFWEKEIFGGLRDINSELWYKYAILRRKVVINRFWTCNCKKKSEFFYLKVSFNSVADQKSGIVRKKMSEFISKNCGNRGKIQNSKIKKLQLSCFYFILWQKLASIKKNNKHLSLIVTKHTKK